MDLFIQYGLARRARSAGAVGLGRRHAGKAGGDRRRSSASGVGGSPVMAEAVKTIIEQGPAAAVAVHGAELSRQSRGRLDLDPLRLQGPDRRAGDGLRRVGPGDRRRDAADPHRRGRGRGVRRRRGLGRSDLDRRLCREPGARHQLQRPADRGLAAVRQGPCRLRAGRGRGGGGDREAEPRAGARRHAAGDRCRLRHLGRCLPPDVRLARWGGGAGGDAPGDPHGRD